MRTRADTCKLLFKVNIAFIAIFTSPITLTLTLTWVSPVKIRRFRYMVKINPGVGRRMVASVEKYRPFRPVLTHFGYEEIWEGNDYSSNFTSWSTLDFFKQTKVSCSRFRQANVHATRKEIPDQLIIFLIAIRMYVKGRPQ